MCFYTHRKRAAVALLPKILPSGAFEVIVAFFHFFQLFLNGSFVLWIPFFLFTAKDADAIGVKAGHGPSTVKFSLAAVAVALGEKLIHSSSLPFD
jgi:hypothetical protein